MQTKFFDGETGGRAVAKGTVVWRTFAGLVAGLGVEGSGWLPQGGSPGLEAAAGWWCWCLGVACVSVLPWA